MKLIGKVPVEPLDDERLTNIERKLVVAVSDMRAPAPHASRRVLAFAGVAMAIALAGFAGWKLHEAPVVEDTPQTFAIKSDTERSLLDLGDAQLASMPGTDVRVERMASRTSIVMARGTLSLTVEHKPGRLLVVRAGDTEIEDVGTKFSVLFDGKSHVEVRVSEGEVKVHRAGKDFAVTMNNAWTTELGTTTIAQLDAAAVDVIARTNAAQDDSGSTTNHVETNVDESRGSADVDSRGSAADSRGSASENRGSAGAENRGSGSGSGSKKPRLAGGPDARKSLEKWPYTAPVDVGTDDPKAAIALYIDRAQGIPEGEERAMLLYSAAVMQHRTKSDPAALHTLTAVTKRNGGDSKAYKAGRWLEVRIRCLKSFDDACRIAAERYRNQFPSGSETGIVDQILREIAL